MKFIAKDLRKKSKTRVKKSEKQYCGIAENAMLFIREAMLKKNIMVSVFEEKHGSDGGNNLLR